MKEENIIETGFSYKRLFIPVVFVMAWGFIMSLNQKEESRALRLSYDPAVTRVYFKNGNSSTAPSVNQKQTQQFEINDVIPTVAMGGSLDVSWLSAFGVTSIKNIVVTAERNTGNVFEMVNVNIKSKSLTAITYNLSQPNPVTLSVGVLYQPMVAVNSLSDVRLHFTITTD